MLLCMIQHLRTHSVVDNMMQGIMSSPRIVPLAEEVDMDGNERHILWRFL